MKTLKYIVLGVVATVGLTSCNLDFPPTSYVQTDNYYTTASEVNTALMGVYNALYDVMDSEWQVTEMRSDNTRTTSTSSTATTSLTRNEMDQNKIQTTSSLVEDYWVACWALIARANLVLDNIAGANDEPDLRNQYEAEALFLRAHIYFNLVRLWGPMFKVETTLEADDAFDMQRSSESEIYAMIERDLERIIWNDMLPEVHADADTGRVTMNAARFLLAKVYATNTDYTQESDEYLLAIDLLESVIGGITSLPVAYADIYDVYNEMNAEIIFAVRYTAGSLGLGSPFANDFVPSSSGSSVVNGDGNGLNYPTTEIYNAFEEGDIRRDISLALWFYNTSTGETEYDGSSAYIKKYLSEVLITDDAENDWPVMRMGDATLLYAELVNEVYGPTADAFAHLNMTRQRAGLADLTSADLTNKYDFREAIKAERRVELAFENQRMFDLLRWGRDYAAETISVHLTESAEYDEFYADFSSNVLAIEEWQTILPIPYSVMLTNPGIAQNYGY